MPAIGSGVRIPATTSSPCAFARNSPHTPGSPVDGSRVKHTPVPEVSPRLPKTIWTMFTAVPRSSGMACARRYTWARGVSHESNTALTERSSCTRGSCGKSSPAPSR